MSRLFTMYFSGTGTTEKVVRTLSKSISENSDFEKIEYFDFTPLKNRDNIPTFTKEDVVIIALPTIAGRVPNLMLKYLDTIIGNSAIGIAVMTFGNRSFDDSRMEIS